MIGRSEVRSKRVGKAELLQQVIQWSRKNHDEALKAWEISAAEPIEILRAIESGIGRLS
jgi:hypothetical protein